MTRDCRERDGLRIGEIVFASLMLVGLLWLAWLIVRWIVETREGKYFAAFTGVVLSILWLAGAFAAPAGPSIAIPVVARTPSTPLVVPSGSGQLEIFSSGPDGRSFASMTVHNPSEAQSVLRRVRGGFELCTTLSGQTSCRPMQW